jgi:hypothetical protein
MRLLHTAVKTSACFDDPNLISHAGLVPAARLLQNVGLEELVDQHLRVVARVGANAPVRIGWLIAGMIAGADTIDGMDLLRHGALPNTFAGIRAPVDPGVVAACLRLWQCGPVGGGAPAGASNRRSIDHTAATSPNLRCTVSAVAWDRHLLWSDLIPTPLLDDRRHDYG